nr:DUF6020 family protein [Lachnospiraceae bacterium]
SVQRTLTALAVTLGIMIFTVPLTGVVLDICDRVNEQGVLEASPGKLKPWAYFLILWAVFFLSFLPLFLYTYPINIFGDATDALVGDYLQGGRSTHHTPIHWIILGKFYDFGVKQGSANLGMSLFVIMQMLILSASLAFLSYYLYKKQVRKSIRILVLLVSILNPVNAYFSVTAEKGTIGMALVLIGIVILCMLYDDPFSGKGKTGIGTGNIVRMLLFVLTVSLGSLFRNNMIYAVAASGIVIALIAKGKKKKCALLLMFALTLLMYRAEYAALVKTQDLITDDKYRESFSLPIMCLSRIAVLHGEDMPEDMYREITYYIPEPVLAGYYVGTADSVKGGASEARLEGETKRFLWLFVRGFFKYPGDYLDQCGMLTRGYWNPLYEHVLTSTTPMPGAGIPDGYMNIEPKNLLPTGGKLFDWMYHKDGRFMIPLFSIFFRPSLYAYAALFAFMYAIYRKSRSRAAVSLIPLMYLGTVFLGPVCQFRYIYFNALCLGLSLYVLFKKEIE